MGYCDNGLSLSCEGEEAGAVQMLCSFFQEGQRSNGPLEGLPAGLKR